MCEIMQQFLHSTEKSDFGMKKVVPNSFHLVQWLFNAVHDTKCKYV